MYYYILQQPKNLINSRLYNRLKHNLNLLGILGEMTSVSPARSIPELVEIALAKNYSTIVAVGSDYLINQVSSHLIGKNCVMGIIPIEASPQIHSIIGTDELKVACESLKLRRLKSINLAYIKPNKFFMTNITIKTSKPTNAYIQIDDYSTHTKFTDLSISAPILRNTKLDRKQEKETNKLNLYLKNRLQEPGIFQKGYNWLVAKKEINIYESILRGEKITINTDEPTPVSLDEKIIAKTPITTEVGPEALKIITTRATILKDKG